MTAPRAVWRPRVWTRLAAVSGLLAVGFGAFAAHGVQDPKAAEWLRTGALYEMTHALAVFAALALARAGARRTGLAAALFLGGTVLFSGSLYAMALGGPRLLGAITPLGGLAFLAGWAVLAWSAGDIDQA